MARKLTVAELVAEGVSEAKAKRIVAIQNIPKPRVITFQFKAMPAQAAEVAKAFPDLNFEKRYKPRKPKSQPLSKK